MLISVMLAVPMQVLAAGGTHTVAPGDTMWKIAVRYQIGYSELLKANPKIRNPALIYRGRRSISRASTTSRRWSRRSLTW
jgi:LysM repeat protein